MGYKNRVRQCVADILDSSLAMNLEVKLDKWDLDEVVRHLLSVQYATVEALSEIYESCGPFFKKEPSNQPPEVRLEEPKSSTIVPTTWKKGR